MLRLSSEIRVVYEIRSKHVVQPERTQTIWRLRVAYWISKPTCAQAHACVLAATYTHTHARTHTHAHALALTHSRAHTHM